MKKLSAIIFITANLAAMHRRNPHMDLAFILNPAATPATAFCDGATDPASFGVALPFLSPDSNTIIDAPAVGQKHPHETLGDGDTEVPRFKQARKTGNLFLIAHSRISYMLKCVRSGEKVYKCPYPGCGYESTWQNNVNRHTYTHTGERPYKCTEPGCDYATTTNSKFKRHMRIHKKEISFKIIDETKQYETK